MGHLHGVLGLFDGGVVVNGGNIDLAITQLKRKISKSGVRRELRLRDIPKRSERRKAKRRIAEVRRRRAERRRREAVNRHFEWGDRKGRRWAVVRHGVGNLEAANGKEGLTPERTLEKTPPTGLTRNGQQYVNQA